MGPIHAIFDRCAVRANSKKSWERATHMCGTDADSRKAIAPLSTFGRARWPRRLSQGSAGRLLNGTGDDESAMDRSAPTCQVETGVIVTVQHPDLSRIAGPSRGGARARGRLVNAQVRTRRGFQTSSNRKFR